MTDERIQFDLEQDIMSCWNLTSDLDTLFEEVVEGELTKDQISNVLLGLSQLYEIKFNKCFRTFETFLKTYYKALRDADRVKWLELELERTRQQLHDYQDREYSGTGEWREYTEDEMPRDPDQEYIVELLTLEDEGEDEDESV